jgi:hypothetical protein
MQEGRRNSKNKKKITITENISMDENREKFFKVIDEDAPSCKKVFEKAYKGSLRAAINAMCLQCTHFDKDYIKHCTSTICPIWYVRPYQKKKG